MKVAKLQIKNFLSIGEVEIQPGKITQICGANSQGKTSILKAIEFAAHGSSDGSLVKRGESEAEIIVEFDDQTVVRRRIKPDGKQAVTVNKGEFAAKQPQTMLDGLFGVGTFNPLDLLDSKKRTEILLSAIPIKLTAQELAQAAGDSPVDMPSLDFAQHGLKVAQQAHQYFYQRRKEANVEAKKRAETARVKRAEIPELPANTELRPRAIIQRDITAAKELIAKEQEKSTAQKLQNQVIENIGQEIRTFEKAVQGSEELLARLEEQIKATRQQREDQLDKITEKQIQLEIQRSAPQAAGPDQAKIAEWNTQIQNDMNELQALTELLALHEKHNHVASLDRDASEAADFAEKITAVVDRLGSKFASELISKAQLPIAGLSYVDGEFFLDNIRIENLSSSASMRLAIAVARSVAGPSKLICLDGAEALDEQSFGALREMIVDDGFQYWISKVGAPFGGVKMESEQSVEMCGGRAMAGK